MRFHSILFRSAQHEPACLPDTPPAIFRDLNLDRIVASVTAGKDEYNLAPFFNVPLHDIDAIAYRHEVMRALDDPAVLSALQEFTQDMQAMRRHTAQATKLY